MNHLICHIFLNIKSVESIERSINRNCFLEQTSLKKNKIIKSTREKMKFALIFFCGAFTLVVSITIITLKPKNIFFKFLWWFVYKACANARPEHASKPAHVEQNKKSKPPTPNFRAAPHKKPVAVARATNVHAAAHKKSVKPGSPPLNGFGRSKIDLFSAFSKRWSKWLYNASTDPFNHFFFSVL